MPEVIRLEGIPELKAALEERVMRLRSGKVAAVAEEAALVIDEAKQAAPYLEGDDPDGHIREDITLDHEGTHATIKVENRHAAFQEFGTSRNAAQPFMHPAAERSRERFPEGAAKVMRGAVEA